MATEITEESGVHKQFMERAKKIKNSAELKDFVDELTTKYSHDYGTICHAIAAAAIGAAHAVERSPQGGITGFQAGAVMWEMIRGWGIWNNGPLQVVQWGNLLYPQYDGNFPRTIDKDIFAQVRDQARAMLTEKAGKKDWAVPDVMIRVAEIAEGIVPAGIRIKD